MAPRRAAFDVIAVIEAAYRLDVDEHSWIDGVAEAAAPLLDDGHGLAGYLIDTSGAGPAVHTPTFKGADPWAGAWRERWWEARVARMPLKLIADLAGFGAATYASESCGAVMRGAVVERLARGVPALPLPPGVSEALVISGFDACGAGAVLFAFRQQRDASPARELSRWRRISSHLASAVRLRRRGTRGRPVRAPHVDRARRKRHSDDALELWPALQDGEAIVPAAGGYVAIESPPDGAPLERLSARERQVAALVALGRSNKAIAYELGVGASTVSSLLSSAGRKLSVAGTGELIWRVRGAVQAQPRASRLARERGLTEAECAILCLLFAGLSDAEMAELRASTRSTVTKQVDAVFKKLGVGSRRELLSSFAPWPPEQRDANLGP